MILAPHYLLAASQLNSIHSASAETNPISFNALSGIRPGKKVNFIIPVIFLSSVPALVFIGLRILNRIMQR